MQKIVALSEIYGTAAVARAMAEGARRSLHSDWAVAITGIAGPGGGTEDKPVGLVYIALATEDFSRCERHLWPLDRAGNKEASAQRALEMAIEYLEHLRR